MKTIITTIGKHQLLASFYLSPFKRYRAYIERPYHSIFPITLWISFWHFVIVLTVGPR